MENIEITASEEIKVPSKDSPVEKYVPIHNGDIPKKAKESFANDWWLESQLNSPEELANQVKNLVDNTWSDDYA